MFTLVNLSYLLIIFIYIKEYAVVGIIEQNTCNTLVELVHEVQRKKKLTLADMAEHLQISRVYMASLSNGARKLSGLDIEKQRVLADLLEINMVDLLILCGTLRQEDLQEWQSAQRDAQ